MSSSDAFRLSRLLHIQEAVDFILRAGLGFNAETIIADEMRCRSILQAMQVMGEAAGKLPPEFMAQRAHIPWRAMIKMRHKIVHDYDTVDWRIVFTLIERELPQVQQSLQELLSQINDPDLQKSQQF